jgi:hypothetical protein
VKGAKVMGVRVALLQTRQLRTGETPVICT